MRCKSSFSILPVIPTIETLFQHSPLKFMETLKEGFERPRNQPSLKQNVHALCLMEMWGEIQTQLFTDEFIEKFIPKIRDFRNFPGVPEQPKYR